MPDRDFRSYWIDISWKTLSIRKLYWKPLSKFPYVINNLSSCWNFVVFVGLSKKLRHETKINEKWSFLELGEWPFILAVKEFNLCSRFSCLPGDMLTYVLKLETINY